MQLVLVHHADAVGPDVDPQRPLSALGRAQADWLAGRVKAAGFVPAAIWHSGKLRARQTAEAFYRLCNPFAEFKMVRGLRPDDPVELTRDMVVLETRDLLLVSHMPAIADLARVLCPGTGGVPLHGLVALERADESAQWTERWRVEAP
jgi:phosphohistidine phosphatase